MSIIIDNDTVLGNGGGGGGGGGGGVSEGDFIQLSDFVNAKTQADNARFYVVDERLEALEGGGGGSGGGVDYIEGATIARVGQVSINGGGASVMLALPFTVRQQGRDCHFDGSKGYAEFVAEVDGYYRLEAVADLVAGNSGTHFQIGHQYILTDAAGNYRDFALSGGLVPDAAGFWVTKGYSDMYIGGMTKVRLQAGWRVYVLLYRTSVANGGFEQGAINIRNFAVSMRREA